MAKVLSFRFIAFIAAFVILVIVLQNKLKSKDDEMMSGPMRIYPYPQNGYGAGLDQLAQPDDVEIQKNGNIIITDVDNNRIQYFREDGLLLKSITAETLALSQPDMIPTGVSIDGQGFVYVSLEGAGRVARFTADMELDQLIGYPGEVSAEDYYLPQNNGLLMKPQGLIVSNEGHVYVIDMAKDVFQQGDTRNFGFRKFKKIASGDKVSYAYDNEFATTQEVTTIMRKSEGLAISEEKGLLFVAEEKPSVDQFGNTNKYRYIAAFDLQTGKFLDRLIGVTMENGAIIDGTTDESIEGLSVLGEHLYAVAEKAGRVDCYDIDSGDRVLNFGSRAPFYCDDESDCFIEGVNYNEQSIIAGTAQVHRLNDWKNNELASPDGVSAVELNSGEKRLAVVDQWNSRVLLYDMDQIISKVQ